MPRITQVVKRTGAVVPFNQERITNAIYRAAVAVGGRDRAIAERLGGPGGGACWRRRSRRATSPPSRRSRTSSRRC